MLRMGALRQLQDPAYSRPRDAGADALFCCRLLLLLLLCICLPM